MRCASPPERVSALRFKREVPQAHVAEESQPVADFLDDLDGDLAAPSRKRQAGKELDGALDRKRRDFRRAPAVHEDVAGRAVQPGSGALRAGPGGAVFRQFLPYGRRLRLLIASFQIVDDPLEGVLALERSALAVEVLEFDLLAGAAEQHQIPDVVGQALERRLDVEAGVPRQGLNELEIVGIAPVPAAHCPACERQMRIGDDFVGIEELLRTQAVAGGAGADGAVEREQPRFEFRQRVVAHGAGELVGEDELGGRGVHERHLRDSLAHPQRGFEGLRQALAQVRPHLESVHHGFDRVLAADVELRRLVEFHHGAVDARAHESRSLQFVDQLRVLSLALRDGGRKHHHRRALGVLEHGVDHLTHGLGGQVDLMIGAAGRPRARIQEADVIVDLGDRAHGRARVVRGGFLLDGNGRGQPFDRIDVRLLHHRQELARVSRQGLDVAALALRVDGVEGEGGLTRTGQPGQDDQPIPRQIEIDILQVVGPGAPDAYILHVTRYYTPGVKALGRAAGGQRHFCASTAHRAAGWRFGASPGVYNM